MGLIRKLRGAFSRMRPVNPPATAYFYGYPAHGTLDPNVTAQYLFEVAAGDLTDTVGAVVAVKTAHINAYSVVFSAPYDNLSPGITYFHTGYGDEASHVVTGIPAGWVVGTANCMFEWWGTWPNGITNTGSTFSLANSSSAKGFLTYVTSSSGMKWVCELTAEDGTGVTVTLPLPSGFDDGVPHKYRALFNRAGNLTLYVDGVSVGGASIAALSGKTLGATDHDLKIAGQFNSGAASYRGTLLEWRFSKNITNNSGGRGGG